MELHHTPTQEVMPRIVNVILERLLTGQDEPGFVDVRCRLPEHHLPPDKDLEVIACLGVTQEGYQNVHERSSNRRLGWAGRRLRPGPGTTPIRDRLYSTRPIVTALSKN